MSRIREGHVIAAKYRLERPLARGGMGSIWVARHLQLDMLVAIKFMDGQFAASPEGRARFEREARAVALIQSPHVVHVHDYGIHEGAPYMAMELLKGEDLGTRIRREQRLSLQATSEIMGQVCKALRKAHDAGIIHRDIKPANIYLVREEEEELVKVLDFGVAKMIGLGEAGESTRTGTVVGSVHYMSPEQARGMKDIDHRADLWSLGIIIFRALTGHLPFPGDQIGDVIVKICSEPIPLASSYRPGLGPEVDAFFTRALARRADERFQSARELASALAAVAAQAPSVPAPRLEPASAPAVFSERAGRDPGAGSISSSGVPLVSAVYEGGYEGVPMSQSAGSVPPATSQPPSAPSMSAPTPPIWQGPALGTITRATQSSDIVDPGGARRSGGAGFVAVIAVAALCGVVLVAGGMALFGGGPSGAAAPAGTASAEPSPSAAPVATQVAQAAPTVPSALPAPPVASAAPTASAVAVAAPVASAAPAKTASAKAPPVKPPRRINNELGF